MFFGLSLLAYLLNMPLVFKLSFQLALIIGFLLSISAYATVGETPDKRGIFQSGESRNLLENSSFDEGTSHWMLGKFDGGSGKLLIDTTMKVMKSQAALVITANDIECEASNVRLFNILTLKKNVEYSIMFEAVAEKASIISISFVAGNETIFEEVILLNQNQRIYGPFNYRSPVDVDMGIFSFNLGKTSGKLYFDDVSILEDNSENLFNEIVTKSGVNIYQINERNEVFIQLPSSAADDFIVMVVGPGGRLVKSMRILKGIQEATLDFSEFTQKGTYKVKVITPSNTLAYNIALR